MTSALTVALLVFASRSPAFAYLALGTAVLLLSLVINYRLTATAIVVLGVFLAPMNDIRPTSAAGFLTLADACFFVGFLLLIPVLLGRPLRPSADVLAGVLIVAVIGMLTTVLADEPLLSLNLLLRLLIGGFGLAILFLWWAPGVETVTVLACAYFSGAAVNVVVAVAQGPSIGSRYQGLSTHVNVFGLTCLLALCLLPYLIGVLPPALRAVAVAGALLCLYGVWISGSRAALLVAVVMALLYPVLTRSLRVAGALYLVATLALAFSGALVSGGSGNALGRLLGGGTASGSDSAREAAAAEALSDFVAHPLIGTGFAQALEAHNIYLQMAAASGVLGLIGYLLVLTSAARPLITQLTVERLLAFPALAYLMIGMLTSLMWDRFIWSVLALAFIAPRFREELSPEGGDLAEENT